MSTDRELLELAAKAAGVGGGWGEKIDYHNGEVDLTEYWVLSEEELFFWNPLTDDGDALRLAARLRLQVLPGKHYGDGCSVNPTNHPTPGVTSFVESKDMAEQMRRAITWAAAEIGRSMP